MNKHLCSDTKDVEYKFLPSTGTFAATFMSASWTSGLGMGAIATAQSIGATGAVGLAVPAAAGVAASAATMLGMGRKTSESEEGMQTEGETLISLLFVSGAPFDCQG